MMITFLKFVSRLKYWLLAFFSLLCLCPWFMYAADDLMRQIMEPSINRWTTINVWKSVSFVWRNIIKWQSGGASSMIVRITRTILALVIALSVTMILYNWLIYIVQTWQWKEWKSLVKNVVYIVVWILISLFSVTIITLLQSVSTTLKTEAQIDNDQSIDENATGEVWKRFSFIDLLKDF